MSFIHSRLLLGNKNTKVEKEYNINNQTHIKKKRGSLKYLSPALQLMMALKYNSFLFLEDCIVIQSFKTESLESSIFSAFIKQCDCGQILYLPWTLPFFSIALGVDAMISQVILSDITVILKES